MSTLTQLYGAGARVTSLAGGLGAWNGATAVFGPAVATASGPMTAGAWKTLLSVTGTQGALKMLAARTTNSTSKTLAIRITRDGVVILDTPSASVASTANGLCAYGAMYGSSNYAIGDAADLLFDSSLLIEVKSSATETDGFNFYVNYDTRG